VTTRPDSSWPMPIDRARVRDSRSVACEMNANAALWRA